MTFVKGQSGNPAGRPKGVRNKRSLIAEAFEQQGSAVAQRVLDAALDGDLGACSLVLARLEPPLRPRAERVAITGFDPTAPVDVQAKAVIVSVMTGETDPDTGKFLLDALSAYVGLRDLEVFMGELRRLRDGNRSLPTVVPV